ncbi:MAG: DUF2157 domain-containing protein [Desulfobacterales bacterium]|nr:DUF2157 domain-containing protein [Desulfobacterales bacterium]
MRNSSFAKRIQKELPVWVEQGWVKPDGHQAILNSLEPSDSHAGFLSYALSILGVLLFGSGVITWFAANWQEISKLTKLILLFGSLWGTYCTAGYLIAADRYRNIGQTILLLGVILFGANIMLIAQIYHIDSHYPNGIMLWALGGLLTAFVMRSQPAMVAAIILCTIWTGMENFDFGQKIHWWFLLFLLPGFCLVFQNRWRFAAHAAMIGLLFWCLAIFEPVEHIWPKVSVLYLVQFYFLFYLGAGILCNLLYDDKHKATISVVRNYSIFGAIAGFYLLTFPRFQSGVRWDGDPQRITASLPWVIITISMMTIVVGLSVWQWQRLSKTEDTRHILWGYIVICAVNIILMLNLFVSGLYGGLIAISLNLLFFACLVWMIIAGIKRYDRYLINIAFIFFALGLISRYFDTFWSLLNRSLFFMVGGLILVVGGFFLERQRRKITGEIVIQQKKEAV